MTRAPADTPAFAPGARVLIRDEEWVVTQAEPSSLQGTAVHCTGLSELVRGKRAIFLSELDTITELAPEDTELVADDSPKARKSRLAIESLLRRTPPTRPTITLGHLGAMREAKYQLVPAARALQRPRPRILIADAVGLGKTIEVGILLSELARRGRGERILVVVLKSLLAQIQKELWTRFAIPLVRLDSLGIQRVQRELPANANPFYVYPRVIISIDTLKQNEKYRRDLEQAHWDAVVIDECQNVAARGHDRSLRARLASLLARTSDALILTSATPHDGSARSFASLMNLLDPTAIADEDSYQQEDIRGLYVRRFKKDVAAEAREAFPAREMSLLRIPPSEAEQAAFEALGALTFATLDRGQALFRTTLLKALLSSPQACLATIRERIKTLDAANTHGAGDAARQAARAQDAATLRGLEATVEAACEGTSSKLARLFELLEAELGYKPGKCGKAKVVIFSERIQTLKVLEDALSARYKAKEATKTTRKASSDRVVFGEIQQFTGATTDILQQQIADDFGASNGKIRILLASDAASEGLNLHHRCSDMIHIDIPWSLITLEQRNGRIDRYGQTATPRIRSFLATPAGDAQGDLRVLERLIEKEAQAQANLGDAADLMKLYDADKEAEAVARAVEQQASPEEVLPDIPSDGGLGGFFGALLEEDPAEAQSEVIVEAAASLFEGDLPWAREAFAQIKEELPSLHVEFHDKSLTLIPPEDLKPRRKRLPRELRRRKELTLSVDREAVMDSLDKSRAKSGSWPEVELLWPLHPVAEWLTDRVLAAFRRHQAPVVGVTRGLSPGAAAYVFQGVISNKRSQPVLVDWFALIKDGDAWSAPQPFTELAVATGFAAGPPNPTRELPLAALQANLPAAVERARAHMEGCREQRGAELGKAVRDESRRIKRWQSESLERLAADEAKARTAAVKERIQRQRREVSERVKARAQWVELGLHTEPKAYIRLAVVLLREAD